jgi:phosphatidylglycerophosphate synthase
MKYLPILLIWSRLFIGIIILVLSYSHSIYFTAIAIALVSIGLLTDIFDGIIARKIGVSTISLRRLDSFVDQLFWIAVAVACYNRSPQFFSDNTIKLIVLISAEALTYIVAFTRFRKEVSTHALSSKLWTLLLFATLIQLLATSSSTILFNICFFVGVITRIEIIFILLIIPRWMNDVPSVYHAVLIKKGKPVKRNKLFNG